MVIITIFIILLGNLNSLFVAGLATCPLRLCLHVKFLKLSLRLSTEPCTFQKKPQWLYIGITALMARHVPTIESH